jgi:hypothetical protein
MTDKDLRTIGAEALYEALGGELRGENGRDINFSLMTQFSNELQMGYDFDQRHFVDYAADRFDAFAREYGITSVNRGEYIRALETQLAREDIDRESMERSEIQQVRDLVRQTPGLGRDLADLAVKSSRRVETDSNIDYQEAEAIAAASVILNRPADINLENFMAGGGGRNAARFEAAQAAVQGLGYDAQDAREITEQAVQNVRQVRSPETER